MVLASSNFNGEGQKTKGSKNKNMETLKEFITYLFYHLTRDRILPYTQSITLC